MAKCRGETRKSMRTWPRFLPGQQLQSEDEKHRPQCNSFFRDMRKQIRRAALHLLRNTGVFRLLRESEWRRQRLLILCYHGISLEDEHQWRSGLTWSRRPWSSGCEFCEPAITTCCRWEKRCNACMQRNCRVE